MDLDAKICYCFHVSRRKLVNFVRQERPKVASQLSECGGAGTGCGWCIPFLKQIYEQAVKGGETELERLTPEEYEQRRAAYVRAGKGTPPPGATPLPPEEHALEADCGGCLELVGNAPPPTAFGDYDEQGVDLSLLRWMKSLTPVERLAVMERHARDTEKLLEYGRRNRQTQAGGDR